MKKKIGLTNATPDDTSYVRLDHALMDSVAWRAMSYGPRCLYVALKSLYRGRNNGRIGLSVRNAASELNASRSATERWFRELQEHGFICQTGEDGETRTWRLTELGCNGSKPTRDYKAWRASSPPSTGKPAA